MLTAVGGGESSGRDVGGGDRQRLRWSAGPETVMAVFEGAGTVLSASAGVPVSFCGGRRGWERGS